MHPHAGTHAHPSSYTRTTCAHPHAKSPTHPYTHSSFTHTTCAHPHAESPAHPYTQLSQTTHTPQQFYPHHLCTPLHLLTNINSPQLSQSLFTNICKYPHSTCHNPYNNNCHNPYNQNSILTILTIKIQSNRVDNKRI